MSDLAEKIAPLWNRISEMSHNQHSEPWVNGAALTILGTPEAVAEYRRCMNEIAVLLNDAMAEHEAVDDVDLPRLDVGREQCCHPIARWAKPGYQVTVTLAERPMRPCPVCRGDGRDWTETFPVGCLACDATGFIPVPVGTRVEVGRWWNVSFSASTPPVKRHDSESGRSSPAVWTK